MNGKSRTVPRTRRWPAIAALTTVSLCASCGGMQPQGDGGTDGSADAQPAGPIVQLIVDSDRNGTPEVGDGDRAHRAEWTTQYGASFLANVDDDDGDHTVDAEDEVVNGDADAQDLARILVRAWPQVPNGATGRLTLEGATSTDVRLFRRGAMGWSVFDPAMATFTADDLRAGVELGIEARDFASARWNGQIDLRLSVSSMAGMELGNDHVVMHVAPWVMGGPLDETDHVYIHAAGGLSASIRYTNDMDSYTMMDGMPLTLIDAFTPEYLDENRGPDVWTQDIMEFGHTSIPAPNRETNGMFVVLRAPTRVRPAALVTQREILGPNFGYIWKHQMPWPSGAQYDVSLDSFGNLEQTAPYRQGSSDFPLGRILVGRTERRHGDNELLSFLNAQSVQGPVLELDTSWLLVGHVDEVVSFVPSTQSARHYVLVMPSPALARTVLQRFVSENPANGNVLMFRGMVWYDITPGGMTTTRPAERTVNAILADEMLMTWNATVQARIDAMQMVLQQEMGIPDTDIVRLPVLFQQTDSGRYVAYMPDTPNLLRYGTTVIMPRPHGPVVGGRDYIETDTSGRLSPHGLTPRYAEQWDLLHALDGEVHCGSNPVRRIRSDLRWWEVAR